MCFKQGHFQIILNKEHCPLLQPRLSIGMKLMYCSGVWSYVVGTLLLCITSHAKLHVWS